MVFADIDFYVNDYGGEAFDIQGEKGLKKLLHKAERDVWCVCSDEVCEAFRGREIDGGSAEILKTAVCVQADFLAEKQREAGNENSGSGAENSVGGNAGASAVGSVISSVKLGDFSVNYDYSSVGSDNGSGSGSSESGSGVSVNEKLKGNVCTEALLILDKGGLLYRGGVRI